MKYAEYFKQTAADYAIGGNPLSAAMQRRGMQCVPIG